MLARVFNEEGLKECTVCKEFKVKEEYYSRKDYICGCRPECKKCSIKLATVHSLRKNYGLTLEEYEEMVETQNGTCAICHKKQKGMSKMGTGKTSSLHVDHDHKTGKIRGLLCSDCNLGLGKFSDSMEIILNAAIYLEKYNNK